MLDPTHIQNQGLHFVINSVSFADGKKFRNSIGDRLELRKISDAICAERSKSVVQSHKLYSNKKSYWVQKARDTPMKHFQSYIPTVIEWLDRYMKS